MQYKKIVVIAFLFFLTLAVSQKPWYQGNLRGINDLAFELNIKGIKDDVWQKRVMSYVKTNASRTRHPNFRFFNS